ncbi:sulfite exporter TauE/SafE family protein [Sulfitobacter guttiformis]|uniref:Probable membrane transporter protein n=1 Tax=Sulfitobacter guttiformis TaxID=74349 RepID=A0A420DJD6_9RHOB|nr:sulfite exporter TauE/SafE family protein [Sulfitobacter guttiformis]KIN71829.1 Membrane protein [Sulfitobacter guttiformis KCTC 32187]RKE94356.1 putative membrane protein YfcA [Sulfitobacter guttiformis]
MPETMLLIQMAVLLLVIGAFAGILAGLLGVGGGIVLVPAFFYAFQTLGYGGDQLMQMCLATSLATIIVTSLRSVLAHNKKGAVDWAILRAWAPGIMIGAVVGMLVVSGLRSSTLQAIFGVLALVVGLYMGFGRSEWRLGQAMPKGISLAALSPSVGFLSVLMGIGGGSFGVPLMTLYNTPIHRAVATAAGFGIAIAVPSVIGFLFVSIDPATRPPYTIGAVNLVAFVLVIAMTLITAPIGARMAHAMDPKPLKRVFAVFLVLVALNMLRKAMMG